MNSKTVYCVVAIICLFSRPVKCQTYEGLKSHTYISSGIHYVYSGYLGQIDLTYERRILMSNRFQFTGMGGAGILTNIRFGTRSSMIFELGCNSYFLLKKTHFLGIDLTAVASRETNFGFNLATTYSHFFLDKKVRLKLALQLQSAVDVDHLRLHSTPSFTQRIKHPRKLYYGLGISIGRVF